MEIVDVELLSKIIHVLASLSPAQLTTLLCRTCYERYDVMAEAKPTSSLQETAGICSYCYSDGLVSSPYLNHFLCHQMGCCFEDEETTALMKLVRAWLLPVGYLQQRREDLRYGERESWTWIQYGILMKRAVDRADLTEDHRQLLRNYFSEVYAYHRFIPTTIERNAIGADDQPTKRLPRPALMDGQQALMVFSIGRRIARQLQKTWKGEKG